jgi:hypothetical protein
VLYYGKDATYLYVYIYKTISVLYYGKNATVHMKFRKPKQLRYDGDWSADKKAQTSTAQMAAANLVPVSVIH